MGWEIDIGYDFLKGDNSCGVLFQTFPLAEWDDLGLRVDISHGCRTAGSGFGGGTLQVSSGMKSTLSRIALRNGRFRNCKLDLITSAELENDVLSSDRLPVPTRKAQVTLTAIWSSLWHDGWCHESICRIRFGCPSLPSPSRR